MLVVFVAACSSSSSSNMPATPGQPPTASAATGSASTPTTTAAAGAPSGVCGNPGPAPQRYESVVVFSFENRTWKDVGAGFREMPYLRSLAARCAHFTDWTETNTAQNSLTQYVGQVTGAFQPSTVNDCAPSASCSTEADSIFRQVRMNGGTAINYVEGATKPCSADGNAAKHVPALYLRGADDRRFCDEQVRPFKELDPQALPSFAFVTPTLCNDGHDCDNAVVDSWARTHVQPVLDSDAYSRGKVAVFIWYDEDHPVPNMWIAPTAHRGAVTLRGAGYAGTLKAWESMLGVACLAGACHAPDMRAAANV